MDSNEIDVVDNGAIVKVFLLEGAFPWNAPAAILDNAGSFFSNYGMRVRRIVPCSSTGSSSSLSCFACFLNRKPSPLISIL